MFLSTGLSTLNFSQPQGAPKMKVWGLAGVGPGAWGRPQSSPFFPLFFSGVPRLWLTIYAPGLKSENKPLHLSPTRINAGAFGKPPFFPGGKPEGLPNKETPGTGRPPSPGGPGPGPPCRIAPGSGPAPRRQAALKKKGPGAPPGSGPRAIGTGKGGQTRGRRAFKGPPWGRAPFFPPFFPPGQFSPG